MRPGVTVLLAQDAKINIYGRFDALGTAEDSIWFLPIDEESIWSGFVYDSTFNSNLHYCAIRGVETVFNLHVTPQMEWFNCSIHAEGAIIEYINDRFYLRPYIRSSVISGSKPLKASCREITGSIINCGSGNDPMNWGIHGLVSIANNFVCYGKIDAVVNASNVHIVAPDSIEILGNVLVLGDYIKNCIFERTAATLGDDIIEVLNNEFGYLGSINTILSTNDTIKYINNIFGSTLMNENLSWFFYLENKNTIVDIRNNLFNSNLSIYVSSGFAVPKNILFYDNDITGEMALRFSPRYSEIDTSCVIHLKNLNVFGNKLTLKNAVPSDSLILENVVVPSIIFVTGDTTTIISVIGCTFDLQMYDRNAFSGRTFIASNHRYWYFKNNLISGLIMITPSLGRPGQIQFFNNTFINRTHPYNILLRVNANLTDFENNLMYSSFDSDTALNIKFTDINFKYNLFYGFAEILSDYSNELVFDSTNMFGDPLFVDFDNFDYNLSQNSPAIDAGNPNMLDPDGTRSDIGAYYYHQEASVPENRIPNIVNGFELISVYPNPFNSEFNLTFKNEFPLNVGISMFDLNGRLVKDYGAKWFASGEHKVQFAQQNLPAGQYVLQVKTEYGQFEIQVINIK